ncbi:MAG: hypothetical protein ACHQU8_07075 [Gemmatimonadales bacterium]
MARALTSSRLSLAAALVALLFLAAAWYRGRRLPVAAVLVCLGEAGVLTLLAALWFGSLGSGGWPTVFLLLGALVAGPERGLRLAFLRSGTRSELGLFLLDIARYMAAGALLAWRLG